MSPTKEQTKANQVITAFGEGGQINMLYDRRQRSQSIYLNNKILCKLTQIVQTLLWSVPIGQRQPL